MSTETARELTAEGTLSVIEAARWSGISRTEIYAAIGRGELKTLKIGRRRLVPRKSIHEMLAARMVAEAK